MESVDPQDKHLDPPDYDEARTCEGCGEPMEEFHRRWQCHNPDCEDCHPLYKDADGDDAICKNCNEVLVHQDGRWTHYEDGESPISTCTNPQPKRSTR